MRTLEYMGLVLGTKMTDMKLDKIFNGSCTNSLMRTVGRASISTLFAV